MEEVDFVVVGSLNSLVEESQNNKHNEKVSTTNERISCDIVEKHLKVLQISSDINANFILIIINKDETTLDVFKNEIIMVVTKCVEEMKSDQCLDDDTRGNIASYDVNCLTPNFITQCTQILGNFRSTADADEFYSSFYASIADHSTNYFPGLVFPACTTLCIKVGDKSAVVS